MALSGLQELLSTEHAKDLWPFRERILALHREATFHVQHEWDGLEPELSDHADYDKARGRLRLRYKDEAARALEDFEQHSFGWVLPIHFSEVDLYVKCLLDAQAQQSKPVVLTHVLDDQRVEVRTAWCRRPPRVDTYHEERHYRIPTTESTEKQGFELVPDVFSEFKVQVKSNGTTYVTTNQLSVFTKKVGLPRDLEKRGQVGFAGLPTNLREVTIDGTVDEDWLDEYREAWYAERREEFLQTYDPPQLIDPGQLEAGAEPESPPITDSAPAGKNPDSKQARTRRLPDHPEDPALRVATVLAGSWRREGETLVQSSLEGEEALLLFGDEGLTAYDLTAQVRRSGGDPEVAAVGVLFHALDHDTFSRFSLEGGTPTRASCAARLEGEWQTGSRKRSLDQGQDEAWVRVKLEVRGERISCYVADEYLFMATAPGNGAGRIGLGSRSCRASFRDIEVKTPRGALLWRGLPSLPGDG